jgi:hypothetical protein
MYIPPPVRGTRPPPVQVPQPCLPESTPSDTADVFEVGPRVKLPKFDGINPLLWQDRYED